MQPFPVTESTLSAPHIGHLVEERYTLGPQTTCKLLRTGMNHLYLVTDGTARFVFRAYTVDWRSKTEIAEEVRLLTHLHENNIPVSYPIPDSKSGYIQDLFAPEGMRYGVLFSFADGKKIPRFSTDVAYNAGLAMARMHRATENMEFQRVNYNTTTLLTDSLKRTRAFFTSDSEETTFIEQATEYLVKEYLKVDASMVRRGVVHLDIWFDNMHIKDNGEITLFDFDFCGTGWLCHDIGYFLYQLFWTHPDSSEYPAKAESFLQGYESVTKLTEEEKRIMPIATLGVLLFYISIQCEKFDTWSNIFLNEEHLKRYVASLKRWMAYNNMHIE